MRLENLRERIDEIDRELLVLLDERMDLALLTRGLKGSIEDRGREAAVLERARRIPLSRLGEEFTAGLFAGILEESKRLQRESGALVAFQGEHGAYGEVGARRMVPDGAHIPRRGFAEVISGVATGVFDMGVVPVENSTAGPVEQVVELLARTPLRVVEEEVVGIRHCLLALPGVGLRDVARAYSHKQALGQCGGFLERNGIEPAPFYDTAGAARMIARNRPEGAAAIAGEGCADLYGLRILARDLEDVEGNATRFLLLTRPGDDAEARGAQGRAEP